MKFLVPSAAGVIVFFFPVLLEDRQTIVFGLLTDALRAALSGWLFEILLAVLAIAGLGSLAGKLLGRRYNDGSVGAAAFDAGWGWIALRLVGLAFGVCVYFQIGPQILSASDTGTMVFNDIGKSMLVIFAIGIALMPLLTDYGLLEFAGTLARRAFRRLFRLPGRAVVDTIASIVSASSIGLLVTIFQYERGFYNAREASVIACNFSIVSIPFCLLIADVSGLQQIFFGWYLSVIIACLMCAFVLARVRPLAGLPTTYLVAVDRPGHDASPSLADAYAAAIDCANAAPNGAGYVIAAWRNFVATAFGVIGPAMALATFATIAIFHTPVFEWLGHPIRLLLDAGAVAQAELIAPGFIVGFVDQFMPAIIARSVDAEYWRFVLGGLSVTQLVFLSEFGMIVLRSKLPIGLGVLLLVFVQRTLITAPVLMLMGLVIVG